MRAQGLQHFGSLSTQHSALSTQHNFATNQAVQVPLDRDLLFSPTIGHHAQGGDSCNLLGTSLRSARDVQSELLQYIAYTRRRHRQSQQVLEPTEC